MSESMIPFRRPSSSPGATAADALPGREALARALAEPTFELLPLGSAPGQLPFIPTGAWVSVTASPAKGIDATIDFALTLQSRGFQAIPHVAARMVRDRSHLREILLRLRDGGVDSMFVIGGDATEPGDFPDGLSLLRAMADLGLAPTDIGIPCYPEGHAFIPDDVLRETLEAKAPFAHYVTTQMCFDARPIATWLAARRAEGFSLPVQLGIPGAVEPQRLLSISARIGVRDTARFVMKNVGFVGRLLRSGGFYRPDRLLDSLAPLFANPVADVRWIHLYTFNGVEANEVWRARYLGTLPVRQPA